MDTNSSGVGGIVGSVMTVLAATGITTEVVQIIYYILGGIGFLLTIISVILGWYKAAKADGKITVEEAKDLVDKINDEVDKEIKK